MTELPKAHILNDSRAYRGHIVSGLELNVNGHLTDGIEQHRLTLLGILSGKVADEQANQLENEAYRKALAAASVDTQHLNFRYAQLLGLARAKTNQRQSISTTGICR